MADSNSKAGRPSKRTDENRARILELVQAGDPGIVAAGRTGLSERTYYEWVAADEDFRNAVACAEKTYESLSREVVQGGDEKGASFGPAKARLEHLQRRFPKRWSVQIKVEMADQLNRYLDVAARVLEPEAFGKLLEALAEEPGEGEAPGDTGGEARIH